MPKFLAGDFVKHKESSYHVFRVVEELTSVPPGGKSLYECKLINARGEETVIYHENDLDKADAPNEPC